MVTGMVSMDTEYIAESAGIRLIMTRHCRARVSSRTFGMSWEGVVRMLSGILDHILQHPDRWGKFANNTEVFVFFASYRRGAVVAYRRDTRVRGDHRQHVVVMTVYPRGVTGPVHLDTPRIVV